MKKIIVVVADGKVESIFSEEEIEVEVIDFDDDTSFEEQEELADYVDECRATMKETIC